MLLRGSRGAQDRHGRLHLYAETVSVYGTERAFIDGRRHALVEGMSHRPAPRAGSRCAAPRVRLQILMGFHEAKSPLYLSAPPVPAKGDRCSGNAERRDRWCPARRHHAGRCARADGREPDRRLARPRMCKRQRRAADRIRNSSRRQDPVLSNIRLRPDLFRRFRFFKYDNSFNPFSSMARSLRTTVLQRLRSRWRTRPGRGDPFSSCVAALSTPSRRSSRNSILPHPRPA